MLRNTSSSSKKKGRKRGRGKDETKQGNNSFDVAMASQAALQIHMQRSGSSSSKEKFQRPVDDHDLEYIMFRAKRARYPRLSSSSKKEKKQEKREDPHKAMGSTRNPIWFQTPDLLYSKMSKNQKSALNVLERGVSAFVTGPAGTGKSFLQNAIYCGCIDRNLNVIRSASTGTAAKLVSGQTLHSAVGIQLGSEPLQHYVSRISKVQRDRWLNTDVLMIDEISGLDWEYLKKAERVIANARKKSHRPWGGIQVIAFGDFLQLSFSKGPSPFIQPQWSGWFPLTLVLQENFRQHNSNMFESILNEVRKGELSSVSREILNTTIGKHTQETQIVPYRAVVKKINEQEHINLKESEIPFHPYIRFERHTRKLEETQIEKKKKKSYKWEIATFTPSHTSYFNELISLIQCNKRSKSHQCWEQESPHTSEYMQKEYDQSLEIAQKLARKFDFRHSEDIVELCRKQIQSLRVKYPQGFKRRDRVLLNTNLNISMGLVNGLFGTIVGFTSCEEESMRTLTSEELVKLNEQISSNKEYKYSKHKSLNPPNLEPQEIKSEDMGSPFSWAKEGTEALCPTHILWEEREEEEKEEEEGKRENKQSYISSAKVSTLYPNGTEEINIPIVYFEELGYVSIPPCEIRIPVAGNGKGDVKYKFIMEYIPLELAWCTTIHKIQGQTLDKVAIRPKGIREPGQLYVALSRARSMDDIKLLTPIQDEDLVVDPAAKTYYGILECTIQELGKTWVKSEKITRMVSHVLGR